jgi:hypothetical protein
MPVRIRRRHHVQGVVQPTVVMPVDLIHRCLLHVCQLLNRVRDERTILADISVLEQSDRRFGQSIVIGISDPADGSREAYEQERFGEADQGVLGVGVAVVDQALGYRCASLVPPPESHHLECGKEQIRGLAPEACQPTMTGKLRQSRKPRGRIRPTSSRK